MTNHYISKPRKKLDLHPLSTCRENEIIVEFKDPIDNFKLVFGDVKENVHQADVALKNIGLLIESFNPSKGHSPVKFKEVVQKFNNTLRKALQDVNVNMMLMEDAISQVQEELCV